jgi:uncharacterized protein (AIM24 family)
MPTSEIGKVTHEQKGNGTTWQVLAYPELVDLNPNTGNFDPSRISAQGGDMRTAMVDAVTPYGYTPVYPIHPKQSVKITMQDSSVLLEPGAMHFTKGNVQMSLDSIAKSGGIGGFIKKAATSIASGESMIKPRFSGTGDLYLEPTRNHLFLIPLQDDTFICDQGLWVACDGEMEVDGQINKFSAAMSGGEGMVMPRVRGTGVVLMESPVPKEKIMVVKIKDEELRVDGSFVMAFWGDIEFTAQKASPGLLSSAASGEGMVNSYKGTGTILMNMEEAGCFKTDL